MTLPLLAVVRVCRVWRDLPTGAREVSAWRDGPGGCCVPPSRCAWIASTSASSTRRLLSPRTDTDAIGMVGPLPGEAVGWLVHPALADSMLHLTAVAPKPPEGGWPWMSEDEREGRVKGIND